MSHNTIIHHLVRPVVRIAARTSLTPNQITTLRLATGLAAAICFAKSSNNWMNIGGLIFLCSMLLDRADGELARQTNQMSVAGYRYDLAADCIASIAAFVGLGIGVSSIAGPSALWLGTFAGLGIGVLFIQLNMLKLAAVNGYELFGGKVSIDPDDAMIFVPILIWFGFSSLLVILAGVIIPIAVVCVFGVSRLRVYSSM